MRALSSTFYRIPKKFSLGLFGDAVAKTDFVGAIYIFGLPNLRDPVTNTESALKCGNCKNLLRSIVADSAELLMCGKTDVRNLHPIRISINFMANEKLHKFFYDSLICLPSAI